MHDFIIRLIVSIIFIVLSTAIVYRHIKEKNGKLFLVCFSISIMVVNTIYLLDRYNVPTIQKIVENVDSGKWVEYLITITSVAFGQFVSGIILFAITRMQIKEDQNNTISIYKDEQIKKVLPIFSVDRLIRFNKKSIFDIDEDVIDGEINERDYKEEVLKKVYYIIEDEEIILTAELSDKQKKLIENDGSVFVRDKNGTIVQQSKKTMVLPLVINNVGCGAAVNVAIGVNKENDSQKKYCQRMTMKIDQSIYITLFIEDVNDKVLDDYLFEIVYEDIYKNSYRQSYKIKIDKGNDKKYIYFLSFSTDTIQEKI